MAHEGEDVCAELVEGAVIAAGLCGAGGGFEGEVDGGGVGGRQDGADAGHAVGQRAGVLDPSLGAGLGVEEVGVVVADGDDGLLDGLDELAVGLGPGVVDDAVLDQDGDLDRVVLEHRHDRRGLAGVEVSHGQRLTGEGEDVLEGAGVAHDPLRGKAAQPQARSELVGGHVPAPHVRGQGAAAGHERAPGELTGHPGELGGGPRGDALVAGGHLHEVVLVDLAGVDVLQLRKELTVGGHARQGLGRHRLDRLDARLLGGDHRRRRRVPAADEHVGGVLLALPQLLEPVPALITDRLAGARVLQPGSVRVEVIDGAHRPHPLCGLSTALPSCSKAMTDHRHSSPGRVRTGQARSNLLRPQKSTAAAMLSAIHTAVIALVLTKASQSDDDGGSGMRGGASAPKGLISPGTCRSVCRRTQNAGDRLSGRPPAVPRKLCTISNRK